MSEEREEDTEDDVSTFVTALVSPSPGTRFSSVCHAPLSGSDVIFLCVLVSQLKCKYLVA